MCHEDAARPAMLCESGGYRRRVNLRDKPRMTG
jgi:hypothetical protein